jgi:hypothetical protein
LLNYIRRIAMEQNISNIGKRKIIGVFAFEIRCGPDPYKIKILIKKIRELYAEIGETCPRINEDAIVEYPSQMKMFGGYYYDRLSIADFSPPGIRFLREYVANGAFFR